MTQTFSRVGSDTLIVLSLLYCLHFPSARSIGLVSVERPLGQSPRFQIKCSLHLSSHSIQCLPVTLSGQRHSPLLVGPVVWRAQTGPGVVSASNITEPKAYPLAEEFPPQTLGLENPSIPRFGWEINFPHQVIWYKIERGHFYPLPLVPKPMHPGHGEKRVRRHTLCLSTPPEVTRSLAHSMSQNSGAEQSQLQGRLGNVFWLCAEQEEKGVLWAYRNPHHTALTLTSSVFAALWAPLPWICFKIMIYSGFIKDALNTSFFFHVWLVSQRRQVTPPLFFPEED